MPKAAFALSVLIASLSVIGHSPAQNTHIPIPPAQPQAQDLHIGVPTADSNAPGIADIPTSDIQKQQALAASSQRQLEIRRDTDKMLQLTAELRDSLQKADPKVASVDILKKAEQIEKLAHSVRSKLKLSF